jgi:hypothetical protein
MTNDTVALFRNFSAEPFIGEWGGARETFLPGESKYMEAWKANHYAKHLANRELLRDGHETHTSPKNPGQDVIFMEYLNKAMTVDIDSTADSATVHSDTINRNEQQKRGKTVEISNTLEDSDTEDYSDVDEESLKEESAPTTAKNSKKSSKKTVDNEVKAEEDDFEGTQE